MLCGHYQATPLLQWVHSSACEKPVIILSFVFVTRALSPLLFLSGGHAYVGKGLCDPPLGIRIYEGNGDNVGTMQEVTDRCAAACLNKQPPLANGPWSRREHAVGFGVVESNGRCYCNHVKFASCPKQHTHYKSYEFNTGEYPPQSHVFKQTPPTHTAAPDTPSGCAAPRGAYAATPAKQAPTCTPPPRQHTHTRAPRDA